MKMKFDFFMSEGESLQEAAEKAQHAGFRLNKYADPTEGQRLNLSVEEAVEVAREDVNLIYCERDEL